jgi:hypothetical protein
MRTRRTKLSRVAATAAAAVAVLSLACEKIIHFDDFSVGTPPAADAGAPTASDPVCTGLAAKCLASPNAAGLRHPPCPKASDAPDTPEVYVYAWRRLRLGMPDPSVTTEAGAYDTRVGYDLDCSDHSPDGLPTSCRAQGLELEGGVPWQIYPRGIDNAIAQRILGPINAKLYDNDHATFVSLDDRFSRQLELGHGSVLTIVYNWNGTANDPVVSVRSVSGLGIVGSGEGGDAGEVFPKWDGTDKWIAATDAPDPDLNNFQIPKVNSATDKAYVADGVLVADFSFLNTLRTHIVNNGVSLEVPLRGFHMVGDITPSKLSYAQGFGRWPVDEFISSRLEIAAFLSGCDALNFGALKGKLASLGTAAADLPLDESANKDSACNAISSTWAADAERAAIGDYKTFPPPSSGPPCP